SDSAASSDCIACQSPIKNGAATDVPLAHRDSGILTQPPTCGMRNLARESLCENPCAALRGSLNYHFYFPRLPRERKSEFLKTSFSAREFRTIIRIPTQGGHFLSGTANHRA